MNKKLDLRKLTVTAVMSAVSLVLMMLEFAFPFVPSFLKFDFSDLPAFITAFSLGPVCGVTVELIKNLLHLIFTATGGVGELANFIIGAALVAPAGIIYKYNRTRKGALIGALTGSLFAALISFPVNYFITYPFYTNFMPLDAIIGAYHAIFPFIDSLPKALVTVNIPFTLLKGLIDASLTFAVYKKLSPILKKKV